MNLPPKGSIVGIWHENHVSDGIDWGETFKYVLGDPTGPTKVSYWLTPLVHWYENKIPDVRMNVKQYAHHGLNMVTKEEYIRRWEAKKLQIEQDKMWKLLSRKS